jgi:hypothetical protein
VNAPKCDVFQFEIYLCEFVDPTHKLSLMLDFIHSSKITKIFLTVLATFPIPIMLFFH